MFFFHNLSFTTDIGLSLGQRKKEGENEKKKKKNSIIIFRDNLKPLAMDSFLMGKTDRKQT